jgi:hypothetical protein
MNKLNLAEYLDLFPDSLQEKYKSKFEAGFSAIDGRFRDVRSGRRLLTVDDVMAIFEDSLPFVCDWTKPDRGQLEERMAKGAPQLIRDLQGRHDLDLIRRILECFGELSLTSLVLQHVYPENFCMCSHHIASLLYIVGHRLAGTVPEYYREYCRELEKWGSHFKLTVVQTEFALWTWYRLANYGSKERREEHRSKFDRDPWVRKRRALRARESLKATDKIGLARFCLDTDPTLGAIIAWREFEIRVRDLPGNRRVGKNISPKMSDLIAGFPPSQKETYTVLWEKRNRVMHHDLGMSEEEARKLVQTVSEFLDRHKSKPGLD